MNQPLPSLACVHFQKYIADQSCKSQPSVFHRKIPHSTDIFLPSVRSCGEIGEDPPTRIHSLSLLVRSHPERTIPFLSKIGMRPHRCHRWPAAIGPSRPKIGLPKESSAQPIRRLAVLSPRETPFPPHDHCLDRRGPHIGYGRLQWSISDACRVPIEKSPTTRDPSDMVLALGPHLYYEATAPHFVAYVRPQSHHLDPFIPEFGPSISAANAIGVDMR